ncbi:MAG: sigma-70 family RNA polymerase sigma factor [Prevotella sp.]|jgi:RNA polymerase sigma-70 factor (ECF subfamily)|nr:sigma-70 family RNA polymerase sigma factor [Prevotella sp.]MCI1281083.1 sigma-70 family RNA polymerase sigma factor [Prevotella sp.]
MDDQEIVKKILQQGDTQSYGEIMNRYSGLVFSKTMTLVHREEMAKDITQQAFIRAFSSLENWQGASLGSWITTIAIHLSLDALRKERQRPTASLDEQRVEVAEQEGFSEDHERRLQVMERAVSTLPEEERRILKMFYYQQMKTSEVAETLKMTQANVLVKLHRIRERLRKQMQNEGNE